MGVAHWDDIVLSFEDYVGPSPFDNNYVNVSVGADVVSEIFGGQGTKIDFYPGMLPSSFHAIGDHAMTSMDYAFATQPGLLSSQSVLTPPRLFSRINHTIVLNRRIKIPITDGHGNTIGVQEIEASAFGEVKLLSSVTFKYKYNAQGEYLRDENNARIITGDIVYSAASKLNVRRSYGEDTPEGMVPKNIVSVDIVLDGNPLPIEFSDFGGILGQRLGYLFAGGDALVGIVSSALLQTLGDNLGDVLDGIFSSEIGTSIDSAFSEFGDELLSNLKSAGIGAVSSFLTAELVNAIGITGFAGELANTAGGVVVNQIITNIVNGAELFSNINPAAIGTAIGSFLGNKLANAVHSFDTIGGQIGSAVGSSLAVLGVSMLIGGPPGLIIAAAAAFIGNLIGGLIGSIFGGIPRSGADSQWDATQQKFVVANIYARKGGSKDAARSVAAAVSDTFNAILATTGGTLLNPEAVQSGNYGMYKKDFVYRPSSTQDTNAITQRFSGKTAAQQLIGYGLYQGLTDSDFQIVGGDIYVKRALYNTFSIGGIDPRNFDSGVLLGNLSSAQQYQSYLANATVINALVAAEPNSVFAIETLLTLARADELGLTRRAASDWFGGFSFLIGEAQTNAAAVEFGLDYDPASGQVSRLIAFGNYTMNDTVDVAGQTTIEGTATANTIDLRSGSLANQIGYTVNGHLNNDIAVADTDFRLRTAAATFASGTRSAIALVGTMEDSLVEEAEKFDITLSNAVGMSIVGPAATVTILPYGGLPWLTVGRSYAVESDGYAVFRIALSAPAASAVSIALALADGRATAGTDYGTTLQVSADGITGWTDATSLTLPAGTSAYFVRVAVLADNGVDAEGKPTNVEGNESFTLTATVTAGAAALANGATPVSGKGTIIDGTAAQPYVWIDDMVRHERLVSPVWINSSRVLGSGATVQYTSSDRTRLDIAVAATVDAGDGDDIVYASNLGDNIFGGAGSDTLYGGRLDDWLLGGDGDDMLNAGSIDAGSLGGDGNYLDGGAGNDTLIGREGSDWLEGGDGADILEGGDADDVLAGGAGTGDVSRGGRGNDQYIFRAGDGVDEIRDESGLTLQSVVRQAYDGSVVWDGDALSGLLFRNGRGLNDWSGGGTHVTPDGRAAGGDDALVFGTGVDIDGIKISKSGDGKDLIIELWPDGVFAGDRVTLKDWFDAFNRIETLRFADGNEIRIADFDTFILGSDGAETIVGTAGNDFVHAGAGNDLVYLLSGNDFGNGGLGDDSVSGDSGNDIVVGADGADMLYGGFGNDSVSGGRGDDRLTGDEGSDILAGGTGDDEIVAGAGDDTIKYQRGDGRDVLIDAMTAEWVTVWISGQGGQNGYVVGPDGKITHSTLGTLFDGQTWSARTRYDIETGTLTVHRPANPAITVANSGTDTLEFGMGIDINDIQFKSSGNDLIVGIEGSGAMVAAFDSLSDQIVLKEWLSGTNPGAKGAIEKFVFFNTGVVDTSASGYQLKGGSDGNDSGAGVTGSASRKNWITGGGGDDVIVGAELDDILNGNSGRDTLSGGAGADALLGGVGDDVLIGGAGADILVGGGGFDTASYESASAGLTASLVNAAANTGDAAGDTYDGVSSLRGSNFVDVLEGNLGENELRGGLGDDMLKGGQGDDLYIFARGDGTDTIGDQYIPEKEVIVDASGQLRDDYVGRLNLLRQQGGQYYFEHVVVDTESGAIVYRHELAATTNRDLALPTTYVQGSWRDGSGYVFTGQEVADPATLGPGGLDTILLEDATAAGAAPTADLTIGLTDLSFAFVGNNLEITLNTTTAGTTIAGGKIVIQNFRSGADVNVSNVIETLQFSDGSSLDLAGLRFDAAGVLISTASTDTQAAPLDEVYVLTTAGTLSGGFGNDTLIGSAGADTLQGGDGDDTLAGGLGADSLQGGAGVDTVSYVGSDGLDTNRATGVTIALGTAGSNGVGSGTGSEAAGDVLIGIENVLGSQFADSVTGSDGDNILKGNRGNDTLAGGAGAHTNMTLTTFALGNDVLLGDDGSDTLRGGLGEDNLDGGADNDVLEGGGDRDVLAGGDGNDILRGDSTTDAAGAVETGDYGVGANLLANDSFEDTGEPANDVAQGYGLTSVDLPGWKSASGDTRPFQLLTAAAGSGITGFTAATGARAIHLDDGIGNRAVTQTIANLAAGEVLTLNYSHAARAAGVTGSYEILWNDVVVRSSGGGTTALTAATALSLTAKDGANTLSFRATGASDGFGAVIDSVRLARTGGAADKLSGGAGSDRLLGGGGHDVLLGGDGDDNAAINVVAGVTGQTFAAGLYGGAGNDILQGGAGNDTLDGGSGNDQYLFERGSGADVVTVGGGQDDLIFDKIAHNRIWLRQVGSDLEITAIGEGAAVLVTGWFTAATNQARRIVVADKALARSDVQALVAAMAGISATVPAAYPTAAPFLETVAARWQDNATYTDRAVYFGTSAADTIVADATLIGGAAFYSLGGNDILTGTTSDDEFHFNTETGFDTIDAGAGFDTAIADVNNAIIGLTSTAPAVLTSLERITANGKTNVVVNLNAAATIDFTNVELVGIARINGSSGNDIITGGVGDDFIAGEAGNDVIRGGTGNDRIQGGAGSDNLDGGDGIDTYDASDVTVAGTIEISSTAATTHVISGATDTLAGFENVIGGTLADTITGSDIANTLEGRAGNDIIDGGAGDDVLLGGAGADQIKGGIGSDTASYEGSATAVAVNLASHTLGSGGATGGDALGDTFDSIENLIGSEAADSLTGSTGDNVFTGGGGNDEIIGGSGIDTAVFKGKFADYLITTVGSNVVVKDINAANGSEGDDTLTSIERARFADVTISLGIETNNAPVLGDPAMEDRTWEDGKAATYQIPGTSFIDLDIAGNGSPGDVMVLSATLADGSALPSWLSFNTGTRTFSGTPPLAAVGSILDIKVTGTDSGYSVFDNFTITIAEARGADVVGTTGADTLNGTARAETVIGNSGDDVLKGSVGADRLDGGAGTDIVDYAASATGVAVDLTLGRGTSGDALNDELLAIEAVRGSAFADNITGSAGQDDLRGGAGDDRIEGGGDSDLIEGGAGVDTLLGGAGIDTIHARTRSDGSLEDIVDGGDGVDELRLGGDAVRGIAGSAYAVNINLNNATGNPTSIEHVIGTDFDDTIIGNGFGNKLHGGLGRDRLSGGLGNDRLEGGAGDDVLVGGFGADALDGGDGNDTADYFNEADGDAQTASGVTVDLSNVANNTGVAAGDTFVSIENVRGTAHADTLRGDAAANVLKGREGNDSFQGNGGNDRFEGGTGIDTIVYAGNSAGYSINYAAKTITDTNLADGDDGVDTYVDLEFVQFSNETKSLANQTPVTGTPGLANQSKDDNASFSYSIPTSAFLDNDGDQGDAYDGLRFTAALATGGALPDWLTFNASTKTFFYASLAAPAGSTAVVRVTASDGIASVTSDFTITIVEGRGATITGTAAGETINGTSRAETINALDGNDTINGSLGGDAIDGGLGIDTVSYADSNAGVTIALSGAAGSGGHAAGDTLVNVENLTGSAFVDTLTGSASANIISGGAGADIMSGLAGNDIFNVTVAGEDTIDGGADLDTLSFAAVATAVTANLTTLAGVTNVENLTGGSGNDVLTGNALVNSIEGGAGDDTISGLGGADQLYGQDGNDVFVLDALDDTIDGGLGIDTLSFAALSTNLTVSLAALSTSISNIENITGGSGADILSGDTGVNRIEGGSGDDRIEGGAGADTIDGGAGNDTLLYRTAAAAIAVDLTAGTGSLGDALGDTIVGGSIEHVEGSEFADTISGSATANTLSGHGGDDTIYGRAGDDTIFGGAGVDNLQGEDGDDALWGGDGNDLFTGGLGIDTIQGEAGDDTASGQAGADTLYGGLGNDTLFGDADNDKLYGGDGDDWIYGGVGADILDGGAGIDWLSYHFSSSGVLATAAITVDLGSGAVGGTGSDAVGDTITLNSFENLQGTQGGDTLYGDSVANVIRGGAGADTIGGRLGNDTLYGEDGNDVIAGDDGVDTLDGGAGIDILTGGAGTDTLAGGIDNDILYGGADADILNGDAGNDILWGEAGADIVNGGAGSDLIHATLVGEDTIDGGADIDTVSFAAASAITVDLTNAAHKLTNIENVIGGAGNDSITGNALANLLEGGVGDDSLNGGAGNDVLVGGLGDDTLVGGAGADNFSGGDGADTLSYATSAAGANFNTATAIGGVTVGTTVVATAVTRTMNGVFVHLGNTAPSDGIRAKNADAAGDTFLAPIDIEKIIGSAHADEITGTDLNSSVWGGDGNDVIYGGAGDDILDGGLGDDFIFGQTGVDIISGGGGNDRLFGDGDSDTLSGGDGDDILDAGDAGDTLDGGAGTDIMIGGAGDDTYLLSKTSGSDIIYNYASSPDPDLMDVVKYTADVLRSDLWFTKDAGTKDLLVKILGQSAQVVIKDWFLDTTAGNYANAGAQYVLRLFIAGNSIATTVESLPQLLNVMGGIGEPASFAALTQAQRDGINAAWIPNTPPIVTADATNPASFNEDGSLVLFFNVSDNNQTPLANIALNASATGPFTVQAIENVAGAGNEGRRKVTLVGTPNDSGVGSLRLTANDGTLSSSNLDVVVTVAGVTDGLTLGATTTNYAVPAGNSVLLAGLSATYKDSSETILNLYLENLAVGTRVTSGSHSFIATTDSAAVDIRSWNGGVIATTLASLTVQTAANSPTDLQFRLHSVTRDEVSTLVHDYSPWINVVTNVAPNAPTMAADGTSTFAENSAATRIVTLTRTDPDGTTPTLQITGADAGYFQLLSGNEIWTIANLNYEAIGRGTLNLSVIANDGQASSAAWTRAVTFTNVNEAPNAPTLLTDGASSFTENSAAVRIATLTRSDPDGTTPDLVLTGADAGYFQILNGNEVWTIANLNYEAIGKASLAVNVVASDGASNSATGWSRAVGFVNVNEAPSTPSTNNANVIFNENATGDTGVRFAASDPESDAISYVFAATGTATYGKYEIRNTNQLWVVSPLDFEADPQGVFDVVAKAGGQTSGALTQRVTISNINEAPAVPTSSNPNVTLAENQGSIDTGVRISGGADPEGGTVTYLFGATGTQTYGAFQIRNGNQLWTTGALDRESVPTHVLSIYSHDGVQYSPGSITQYVTVSDVNEAPAAPTSSNSNVTVLENQGAVDTGVRYSGGLDPEGGAVTYLFGATGTQTYGGFEIRNGNELWTTGALDREVAASYGFTVYSHDGALYSGGYVDQTVTVGDVNETPYSLVDADGTAGSGASGTVGTIADGAGGNTLVGITARASDPEGAALTYSLPGNPFGWFYIDPTSGVVSVASGQTVNYESTSNGYVTINVRASDGFSSVQNNNFTIAISDVNEAPWFTSAASASVSEAAAEPTYIATISTADWDLDGASFGEAGHVIYITAGDTSKFELRWNGHANQRQLWTTAGTVLDWDNPANRTHNLQFRVYDHSGQGGWLDAYQNFTVNVSSVAEKPNAPSIPMWPYSYENTGMAWAIEGSVDPDGTDVTYDFAAGGNTGGFFKIRNPGGFNNTATLEFANGAPDFETIKANPGAYSAYVNGDSYAYIPVRIVAHDQNGGISDPTVTYYHVYNVNDNAPNAPVIAAWGTTNFNENTGAGYTVAVLTASDPDGTLNALSYRLTSNPDGMFEIVGNEVRVITSRHFDYERFASGGAYVNSSIGVEAFDGSYVSASTNFGFVLYNTDDNLPVAQGITNQGAVIRENLFTPFSSDVVATASAYDPDGDGISWSIVGGNAGNALTIDQYGQLRVAAGFDYEALGGAANPGVDPALTITLTIRAYQSNNSGRFIDQYLSLSIADIVESGVIFNSNTNLLAYPQFTSVTENFTAPYKMYRGWRWDSSPYDVGQTINYQTYNIYKDVNSDNVYTYGVDISISYIEIDDFGQFTNYYTIAGYSWTGSPFQSVLLQQLPPVVLDLNGAGFGSTQVTVNFDIDGDGSRDKTAWISGGQAFLALDRNGNGTIDNGAEISFIADKPGATTDLEGLAAYDSNADGTFDARDARFADFLVWQDIDEDGVSQASELQSLTAAGIAGIDLKGAPETPSDEGGVSVVATSTFTRDDGSTGKVGDVALRWSEITMPKTSAAENSTPLPFGALLANDLDGNGSIETASEVFGFAAALAAFDSNGDAAISGADTEYLDLRIWRDTNGNGRVELAELATLAEGGLLSISGVASEPETPLPGTPSTPETPVPFPKIAFQAGLWGGPAKDYQLSAGSGTLHVTPRHPQGVVNADAGQIAPSAILNFGNRSVGMLSTILLDLDADGLEARRAEKIGASFDMDADGVADDTGWVSGGDGMLVIDRNGDGAISDASELSFLSEKEDAKSAWEGLGVLDNTKDGKIDKADARFGDLKVWTDRNGDGISQADEIKSLTDMGITEIAIRSTFTGESAKPGYNVPLSTATFKWTNGVTATIGNVALAFDPSSKNSKTVVPTSPLPHEGPDRAERELTHTAPEASASELAAAANAARMMQAMSAFGVGGSESALTSGSMERNAGLDWFTAAAA